MVIVTIVVIKTIIHIKTNRLFWNQIGYKMYEMRSGVDFLAPITEAEIVEIITTLLWHLCPSLAGTLCYIMTFLITVKEGDNSSL